MPQLTDFVSLQAALEVLGGRFTLLERQFDEKFNILQAPTLLQADLAYYRGHCELRGASLAVGYLDIDNFKSTNDTLGHQAGDEALRATAERIVQAVRKSDTVARIGGDEFVVLLPDLIDSQAAETIAAKLVAALSAPVSFAGRELAVRVSIGVCTALPGELDADLLLRNADAALYRAKAKGKGCYQVFIPGKA